MPPHQPSPSPGTPEVEYAYTLDLRRFRKNSGTSLEAISATTKISLRFLQAIEDEEFEKLPGGIFTTNYLRQYAAAIGYDEDALLAHYRAKTDPAPPARKTTGDTRNRNFLDRWFRIPAQASR